MERINVFEGNTIGIVFQGSGLIGERRENKKKKKYKGNKIRKREGGYHLAPLLKETHPLALAIRTPEIAAAAGAVAAVLPSMVTITAAPYASPPKQVYRRGTSTRD